MTPDADVEPTPDVAGATVTVTLRDRGATTSSNATLLAFQDGDGAWQAVEGTGGVYRATTATGRFGVQVVCEDTERERLTRSIRHQTLTDGNELTLTSCADAAPPALPLTIRGTVTGAGKEEAIEIANQWTTAEVTNEFALATRPGPTTLVVSATTDFESYRFARRELANVTTDVESSFDLATDAAAGEAAAFEVDGLTAADTFFLSFVQLATGGGLVGLPFYLGGEARGFALPSAQRLPTDRFDIYLSADQDGGLDSYLWRDTFVAGANSYALPALPDMRAWTPPVKDSTPTTPFQWSIAVAESAEAFATAGSFFDEPHVEVLVSPAWAAMSPTLRIENPDSVTGWNPAWNVRSTATWTIGAYEERSNERFTSTNLTGASTEDTRVATSKATRDADRRARARARLAR